MEYLLSRHACYSHAERISFKSCFKPLLPMAFHALINDGYRIAFLIRESSYRQKAQGKSRAQHIECAGFWLDENDFLHE
jgi:hypothetical protein